MLFNKSIQKLKRQFAFQNERSPVCEIPCQKTNDLGSIVLISQMFTQLRAFRN